MVQQVRGHRIGQDFDKILGSNENKTVGNGIAEAEMLLFVHQ